MELKYPFNALYMLPALAAAVLYFLSLRKKETIMTAFCLGYAIRLKVLRTALLGMGMGLVAFSLTWPQSFSGYAEMNKTGMELYVLVDTSKSMLVSDMEPDRLNIAKKIAGNLLDHLEGDRIGWIPFASAAYIQMPLTDDYQLARMFLDVMDTDMISGGGTNLASAIRLANSSFERSSSADRVILILSDGEEHDGIGLDAIKSIVDTQTKVFAVGIGTEKGGLVPVFNDAGDAVIDYMRDESGNPIVSRLHSDALKELAEGGRGRYYQATVQGAESSALLEALSALRKDTLETKAVKRYDPLYQYFLGLGILLFAIAWFYPERGHAE